VQRNKEEEEGRMDSARQGPPQLEDLISGFEYILNRLLSGYKGCVNERGSQHQLEIFTHLQLDASKWFTKFDKFKHINTALEFFLSRPDIKMMRIGDEFHVTMLASNDDMYGSGVAYGYTPIAAIMMFHHIHGPREPGDMIFKLMSFNGMHASEVVPIKAYKEAVLKRQERGEKTRDAMYRIERMKKIGDMAGRIKIKRLIKV
jgi:hypothetical protein